MDRSHFTKLVPIVILVVAVAGSWAATNAFRQRADGSSWLASCWRIEAGAEQVECLSGRLRSGARAAIGTATGPDRDTQLLQFVRDTEQLAATEQRLAGSCHPAMHDLGRSEGRRSARVGAPPAFPGGASQLCTAGYVHGLAEGYLTGTPDAQVASVFPALCHDTKAREGCAHGVGHALLRARTEEPAVAAARGATNRCRDLPAAFPTNCQNGVYMELAMRTAPAPVTAESYVRTCRSTSDIALSLSCWGYLGLSLNTNDVPRGETPRWCAKADLPGQFTCIDEYGRSLGVEGVEACSASAPVAALRERCVDGAIGLQVGSGHVSRSEAESACRALDGPLEPYCTKAVARYARGKAAVEADA